MRFLWNTLMVMSFISLWIFGAGFFRIRQHLTTQSAFSSYGNTKVIMVLIDAFRIDFASSVNFTFITDHRKNHPHESLTFLSIADAPTATTSRIEAMGTGNIPSFFQISSSFSPTAVEEDHIFRQLKGANKTAAILGDNTWVQLFPGYFEVQFAIESLDANDFHSVDNEVIRHYKKVIQQNTSNFIVLHVLGIDHAGHTYNDSNSVIWAKEQQYTSLLNEIYDMIDDQTYLLIVGDHGMSTAGNHGGDSVNEVSTVIFGTRKNSHFHATEGPQGYVRQVYQIDLVPTLAAMLGISIPYSNLGAIIPEFNLQSNCKANLDQVFNYAQQVKQKYPEITFKKWEQEYPNLHECNEIVEFIYEIQNVSRKVWNEFEFIYLYTGLALMFTILFVMMLVLICQQYEIDSIQWNQFYYLHYRFDPIGMVIISLTFYIFTHSLLALFFFTEILALKMTFKLLYGILTNLDQILIKPEFFILFILVLVNSITQLMSLNKQEKQFWFFFIYIIEFLIVLFISKLSQKTHQIKRIALISAIVILMIYGEQYNSQSQEYEVETPTKLPTYFAMDSLVIQYCIPAVGIALWFQKYGKVNKLQNALLFSLITMYYFQRLLSTNRIYLIEIILPRFVYIFSLVNVYSKNQLNLISLIFTPLLINGSNSLAVFASFIYTLELLFALVQSYKSKSYIYLSLGVITQVIISYYWYMFGNRQYLTTIRYENAYIGFKQFSMFITAPLLLLSLAGLFIIAPVILIQNLHLNIKLLTKVVLMSFFVTCTFQSLHTLLNLDNLLIPKKFAPKQLIEYSIYLIFGISQALIV